jgi:hypothetical protein
MVRHPAGRRYKILDFYGLTSGGSPILIFRFLLSNIWRIAEKFLDFYGLKSGGFPIFRILWSDLWRIAEELCVPPP